MKYSQYIVGNWKMNPSNMKEGIDLLSNIESQMDDVSENLFIGVAAPFVFLSDLENVSSYLSIGAQDVFWEQDVGAYTGEISPEQIKSTGADFVIVGHSERRVYLDESDDVINKKVHAALSSGLKVILCVGEPVAIREKGIDAAKRYVGNQLKVALSNSVDAGIITQENLLIAYEPLWAISTFEGSKPATPKQVDEIVSHIHDFLSDTHSLTLPVLYGGSTDADNIRSFAEIDHVSGVLVGGSSLDADEFSSMIKIINSLV